MKMKAIGLLEFGGPEVLETIEVARPKPLEDQVLIRVQGVSVNFADIQTRKGAFHGAGAAFPLVPGLDCMGIAEEVGSQVTGIKPGDRVIAFPHTGTYSQFVVADGNLTYPIPDTISMEQAAASPLVSFASYMLLSKVARLEQGETLLIHAAAGGIGTTALQIAKSMKAGLLIGTVGSPDKDALARKAGADEVILDKEEDFVQRVKEMTGGRGADVILDSLGGTYPNRGMECLAPYGRLVVFGNATGSYAEINTGLLHGSCRSVLGYSSVTTRKTRPQWFVDTAPEVIRLMDSGELDMKVSLVVSMEEAAEAHLLMEEGRSAGKIVLTVPEKW